MEKKSNILIVGEGKPNGSDLARNIILGLQEKDDKPSGTIGYVSPEIRKAQKIERIKTKFGLSHGKGKSKKNKKKRGK